MSFWMREASLAIGHKKYSLNNLDFSFDIPFEDSDEPPVATVKVTNLSSATRASIKRNDDVVLNAGYEGDVGCLLIGKVVGAKHKQDNTDWVTTLTVQPCANAILNSLVNKTYSENIKASKIVRDLLNIFGVEVVKCELTNDKTYPRGRVCRGNLRQVLVDIVVKECKSRFIIRSTGQIYITKASDGVNTGVTLTSALGLLRSNSEKVSVAIETNLNSQKKSAEKKEETISRSCLLNYRIATAEIVKITSSDLNGRFVVVGGKHVGSRTGDWKTTIELKPYVQPAATKAKTTAKTSTKPKAKDRKIGDVVKFTGSKHYVSSTGDTGYSAKPGPAKITNTNKGSKHPYHLIHTDNSSNVYGWVNEKDFS